MKVTFYTPKGEFAVANGEDFIPQTGAGDIEDELTAEPPKTRLESLSRSIDFATKILQRTDPRVTREHVRTLKPESLRKLVDALFSEGGELATIVLTRPPGTPPVE